MFFTLVENIAVCCIYFYFMICKDIWQKQAFLWNDVRVAFFNVISVTPKWPLQMQHHPIFCRVSCRVLVQLSYCHIITPEVARHQCYAGLNVLFVISVTVISVTFYCYGNDFLLFLQLIVVIKYRLWLFFFLFYESILFIGYWFVIIIWNCMNKFT